MTTGELLNVPVPQSSHLETEDKNSIDPMGLMRELNELIHGRCSARFLVRSRARSQMLAMVTTAVMTTVLGVQQALGVQPRAQWIDRYVPWAPVASRFGQGEGREVGTGEGFMENLALN